MRRGALALSLVLLGLAAWGPRATGDMRSAWLPGVPAIVALLGGGLARADQRCRLALIGVTAGVATLAVATAGVVTRLSLVFDQTEVLWQALVFLSCCGFLLASWPAFRRAEAARKRAEAVVALYEELP